MGIMIASRLQLVSVCRSLETAGLASNASPHLCDPDTRVGKPRRRHIDRQYDRLATGGFGALHQRGANRPILKT